MFNKLWEYFWQQRADYFFYKNKEKNHIYHYLDCLDVKFKRGDYWTKQWIKLLFNKCMY
jgi:hypothetical protein